MKALKIQEQSAPIKEKDIVALEKLLQCKFPDDYENFLLLYNGGHPQENVFPVIEELSPGETSGGVDRFLGFNSDYQYNNLAFLNQSMSTRIPRELIIVASAACGDLICLCVKGKNYGKVYFWDHNWEAEEGEEPTYDNVYLIANSFEDFINSLYEYKEEDEQKR